MWMKEEECKYSDYRFFSIWEVENVRFCSIENASKISLLGDLRL